MGPHKNVARCAQNGDHPQRLKDNLVREMLKTFDWGKAKEHLSTVDLDEATLSEILAHIRRGNDSLIKQPNAAREAVRSAFVEELAKR